MRYGAKILFENVNTTFNPGNRYGLTGPNGSGKSTFMKVLAGELEQQTGLVQRPKKMGILRQDQFAFDQFRVIDTVIMGNKGLWAALQERDAIYEKADMTDEDGMRLGELEGIVADEDGYTAEADAAILLDGLDIPEPLHERKMSELQGGQKVRVLLAQALFGNPQALLLDEPTNHLDLESLLWLEDFLGAYEGTVVIISHDRYFLNRVVDRIAELELGRFTLYVGDYDEYQAQKLLRQEQLEAAQKSQAEQIEKMERFIR
ncbi:MAG TPA: ATP-binding cassette domain-containing protein, partial [Holophagaceae bacterium]|nr:ATP-binding cassette domain-containing protein [Holophagaceae bacterium]